MQNMYYIGLDAGRAFALLTKTYHGSRLTGQIKYKAGLARLGR
jgi:hypothetical protein